MNDDPTPYPLEELPEPPLDDLVTPAVRRSVYFVTALSGAVTVLAAGITTIWFPSIAEPVMATSGLVTAFLGTVAGIFGVRYTKSFPVSD